MRHVCTLPPKSIRSLAHVIGRDYHRVHEDMTALEAVGLLERDGEGIRCVSKALDIRIGLRLDGFSLIPGKRKAKPESKPELDEAG